MQRVTFETYDPTDPNSPRCSLDAPTLSLVGVTTGQKVDAATPAAAVTTTLPGVSPGGHSWRIRCTVNGGLDALGRPHPDYVFERLVTIRSSAGLRKVVKEEGAAYGATGAEDAQNEMVEGFTGSAGSGAYKESCVVATTANIALSGIQTIDGVAGVAGRRTLVWQQTNPVENGVWIQDSGAWTRATDFDTTSEAISGSLIPVTLGTQNGGKVAVLTTPDPITPGTTAMTFSLVGSNAGLSVYDATGASVATSTQLQLEDVDLSTSGGKPIARRRRRVPRMVVRALVATNLAGYAVYAAAPNPTPDTLYTGAVISGVSVAQGGVTLTNGDRVFLNGQAVSSEKGPYQVAEVSGATCKLYRLATLDAVAQVGFGIHLAVEEGTGAGYYRWTSGVGNVLTADADRGYDYYCYDCDDWRLDSDGMAAVGFAKYDQAWSRAQEAADNAGEITFVRRGVYGFDATMHVTKNGITIRGPAKGRVANGNGRGKLIFPAETHGIRTRFLFTNGQPTNQLAWTSITGLILWANGNAATASNDFHGIYAQANVHVDECLVYNFSAQGLHIDATVQGGRSSAVVTCVFDASFTGAVSGTAATGQKLRVQKSDDAAIVFRNVSAVAAGAGTVPVTMECEGILAGAAFIGYGAPVFAPAGSLTTTLGGVTGWTSATNAADATVGRYPSGANISSVRRCRLYGNGKWGLRVDGSDANACHFENCDSSGNGKRKVPGVRARFSIRLTNSGSAISGVVAGNIVISDSKYGLTYRNVSAGPDATPTSGQVPAGTSDWTFEAVDLFVDAHSSAWNAPAAGTITVRHSTSIALPSTTITNLSGTPTTVGTDPDAGGYWDSALIGNTFTQCHTASNWGVSYKVDQGQSVLFGCYQELPPDSLVAAPALIVGGTVANRPGKPEPKLAGYSENASAGKFASMYCLPGGSAGHWMRMGLWGTDITTQFGKTGDAGYQFGVFSGFSNEYAMSYSGSSLGMAWTLTGPNFPLGPGHIMLRRGIAVGTTAAPKRAQWGLRASRPTTTSTTIATLNDSPGVWTVGSIWWYTDAAAGQSMCAVVTSIDGSNNLTWTEGPTIPFASNTSALNFGAALAAGAVATATVTITGAATGDYVDKAVASAPAGLIFDAYVTAANTVTWRCYNGSGGTVDASAVSCKTSVRKAYN